MHRSFFNRASHPGQYEYFEKVKNKKIKDSGNLFGYHLSNEDFYIYLLAHMYNQYKSRGTGLRSLLDIYVFNKKLGASLDSEYIGAELTKLGLAEFERGMKEFADNVFDRNELSEKDISELEFFAGSGAQGTKENVMMQKLNNDDSAKAKMNYLLGRFSGVSSQGLISPLADVQTDKRRFDSPERYRQGGQTAEGL